MSRQFEDTTLNKTIGEQSGNAKAHLDTVQELTDNTTLMHHTFDNNLQNLINELKDLSEHVRRNPHEMRKFMVQKMRPLQEQLLLGQQSQRQENRQIQQNMTEIKRQNKQTAQAIVKTFDRLKQMQQKVGKYL